MKIESDVKLDFCDVLIKPKRSLAASRANVELTKSFKFRNSNVSVDGILPLITANMDTTGTFAMAKAMEKYKCLTALHKFYDIEDFKREQGKSLKHTFYTMGIQPGDLEKLEKIVEALEMEPFAICIDVANGYTQHFVEFVAQVREKYTDAVIMAGNVATPEMTQELIINGKADIVKIGIGPGSVCTTRLKTGCGYPQLSAIAECADVAHGLQAHICADGGCKNPGDVAKAFGAGADFVMIGGMLAGTDECEGKWNRGEAREWFYIPKVDQNEQPENCLIDYDPKNRKYLVSTYNKELHGVIYDPGEKISLKYHGMSSREAMEQHHGEMADYKTAEGIELEVPYKGPADAVIKDILGGLRSACAYVGANSIKDFPKCTTFIRVNRIKENLFEV